MCVFSDVGRGGSIVGGAWGVTVGLRHGGCGYVVGGA